MCLNSVLRTEMRDEQFTELALFIKSKTATYSKMRVFYILCSMKLIVFTPLCACLHEKKGGKQVKAQKNCSNKKGT